MEIRQLRYFLSAAKHLNFTKAARECFIVQTSITHQIAALEKELGVTLFLRTNRSMNLTPAGQVFFKEARRVVAASDRAIDLTQAAARGAAGVFRIGLCGRILCNDLPTILKAFSGKNPGVRLDLRQGTIDELLELLDCGDLDGVLTLQYDFFHSAERLEQTVLFSDRLTVAVSRDHELAARETVTLEDIRDLPYILYQEKGAYEKIQQYAIAGCPLNVYAAFSDPSSVETMVEAGFGISLCLSSMRSLYNPAVSYVRLDCPVSRNNVVLVRNRDYSSPYFPEFRRLLLSHEYHYLKM